MPENNGTIDLKKLRKNLPPPPVPVAPLSSGLPPRPAAVPTASTPPQRQYVPATLGMAPPRPKRGLLGGMLPIKLPSLRYLLIGIAIALAVVVGGYYIYVHIWTKSPFGPTGGDAQAESAAAASTSTADTMTEADIIAAVGKIMLLPNDETPTLAKVSDPSVLQSQTFFKNATVGDVVLMYPKSLRAILFDPNQGKIIEVGPITATGTTTEATSTAAHS